MVDDCCAERKCAGAVSHHLTLPAVLQRPDRLLQEPGVFALMSTQAFARADTRCSTGDFSQPSSTLVR